MNEYLNNIHMTGKFQEYSGNLEINLGCCAKGVCKQMAQPIEYPWGDMTYYTKN